MKQKIKKYWLFILSLLLILSNFSYATQQMLCLMSDGDSDIKCECSHQRQNNVSGLTISRHASPCCSSKTVELSNSNNLQTTSFELPKDVSSFSPLYIATDREVSNNFKFEVNHTGLKDHVPRTEIPILVSSFLL
ncbi:MAG TPA: hypothetical protein VGK25_01995 [Ignavibacteria bacterium]